MIQENEINSTINSINNSLNDNDGPDDGKEVKSAQAEAKNRETKNAESNSTDSANEEKTVKTENSTEASASASIEAEAETETDSLDSDSKTEAKGNEKVTIEFPYSNLLRSKAPKAFDVAEKVATDWKNEGDFTDLGISHPVAGIVASQALQKAKLVEKKLEEKGVFSLAKMGLEIAKLQVENIKNKIQK